MDDKELEMKARERAERWLGEGFDKKTQQEVKALLKSSHEQDRKELIDAFYKNIDFGTGGMRGLMGVGTNRINQYTLARVTQGLINFSAKNFASETLKVVIAHDTRNFSQKFSRQVAEIFSTSGAEVYLFSESMPTPLLSYAVRKLGCRIGVVITASHNPKEYNGYKVYFDDGGQIVPPWDKLIIDEVNRISDFNIESTVSHSNAGKIIQIKDEVLDDYAEDVFSIIDHFLAKADTTTQVVFSSIHGTGGKLIVPFLKKIGMRNIYEVTTQMEEDGNFPTVVYPNPEERETLTMGLRVMEEMKADLLMATDPDADRLGVAVRDQNGKPVILNGNQIGVLLADFILSSIKNQSKRNISHPFMVRTIVTTPLIDSIAEDNGVEVFKVLTGFKYIGELIRKLEGKKEFIFGLEESHGYLAIDKVRDKDAVSSALLFALMASHYRKSGGVYHRLCQIYEKYGFCFEYLASLTKTGPEGKSEITSIISSIRKNYGENGANQLNSERLVYYRDYGKGYELNLIKAGKERITLPSSDVIQLETDKHTLVTIRPSGTEPKIKFYFSVRISLAESGDLFSRIEVAQAQAQEKIESLKKIFVQD